MRATNSPFANSARKIHIATRHNEPARACSSAFARRCGGMAAARTPGVTSVGTSADQRIAELEETLADREDKLREAVALYEQEKHQLATAIHRIEREAAKQLTKSQETFLASFLDVLDDVDRALKIARQSNVDPAIGEGLDLVAQRFLSKLHEHGVERMHTSTRFDPTRHEAIAMATVTHPEQVGSIVDVVSQGYSWGDKVLRPARVIVGKL